jgi:hypothetical protein
VILLVAADKLIQEFHFRRRVLQFVVESGVKDVVSPTQSVNHDATGDCAYPALSLGGIASPRVHVLSSGNRFWLVLPVDGYSCVVPPNTLIALVLVVVS